MSGNRSADIAVIGGGLSGLLAAVRLAQQDRSVVMVAPPRTEDRRTTALLGSSVEVLESLGIWDALAAEGEPLTAIRLIDDTDQLIKAPEVLFSAADIGEDILGINVANEPLLGALEQKCSEAGVEFRTAKANGIAEASDHIAVHTDAGEEIKVALAIAADGRGSPTRKSAGIAFDLEELPQAALVCNVRHSLDHHGITNEFHTAEGPFTFVPLSEHECGLIWVAEPAEAARLATLAAADLAAAIEEKSHGILGAIELSSPVQLFPLATGLARRFASGRLLLAGEAAHVLPPIAAQGFNLTVRDIEAIAELLPATGDPGPPGIASAYRRRREADAKLTVEGVRAVNGMLLSRALPSQLLRVGGLMALANLPALKRFVIRQGLSRR